MNELDPKSYKRLKSLNRKSEWTSEDREIKELLDKGLVDVDYEGQVSSDDNPPHYIGVKCSVNDNGVTYILMHRHITLRRWIPLLISYILSMGAIIISIIALLKL